MSKGYTLIEMLFVLFVLSISSLVMSSYAFNKYELFSLKQSAKNLGMVLSDLKDDSFLNRVSNTLEIYEDYYVYRKRKWNLPVNIKIEKATMIKYNERGNIDKAQSISFKSKNYTVVLVVHLGGGNYEIKTIERLYTD